MQLDNKVALYKCGGQYSSLVSVYFHILSDNDIIWQTGGQFTFSVIYYSIGDFLASSHYHCFCRKMCILWFMFWWALFSSTSHFYLFQSSLCLVTSYIYRKISDSCEIMTNLGFSTMWTITDLVVLYQDSKMAVPLWLPNNPGATQGWTPWVQQGAAAWDQPSKPRGSKELHDLDAPSRIFQAHWLRLRFPRLRVVLRLTARRWRATQGVGCGPESKHEAAKSWEILIAWWPQHFL